ncbi:MAG: hypothetical protein JWL77_652 [Chthonomonadaceae bacterium]|nr:hypothetical protein [Chthonomonadaceae bacterium]
MSNDELLPGSETPSVAEEAVRSAQEPSEAVAPPVAPTRRRRAKPAGTDAATVSDPSVTEPPTRAARSRRKPAPQGTEDPLPAPATEQPAAVEGTSAPEKPASRRRRVAAKVDTPAADVPAPAVVEPEPPVEEKPRTRSRRRPRAAEETPVPAAEAPVPDTEATSTEAVVEPVSAEKPARGARTRPRRKKETTVESLPADAIAGSTESAEEAVALPEAPVTGEAPTTEIAPPERPRRRRSSRSRRRGAGGEEEVGSVEGETVEAASTPTETLVSEEPTSEAEPAATRTRRRGGRSRRSRTDEAEEVTAAVETPAEPEPLVVPEPIEIPIDRTVGTHLISRNGLPEIHIDGVVKTPLLFFGNMDGPKNRQRVLSEVRRAAAAGIHLHSTLVDLPCPLSEASHALQEIDERLRAVLDADPDGYVMPRIVFVPARGWKREYPTDIATYADGTTGDPSLTSTRFWQEAERSLATLIAHLSEYSWGRRVFGYHLERGEWFQSADQGFDRSIANRDAFRDWLRTRYKDNLVSLRAAWYDGDVQFHTAEIPPMPTRTNPQRAFFETRRERRIIDFYEFTSESTAQRLIALSKAVKKAAGHQALVSVCYGYTLEFGHGFSGHLALGLLETAPTIDLICGPPSYRDRDIAGAASFPAPVDSPPLHGKLWLTEDDTKTYLAPVLQDPEDFNPRLPDRPSTEQAMARMQGKTLAHGVGLGFMDLWGEGWLDDEPLWNQIGQFANQYSTFQQRREYPRVPEVVVLIDERSLLHIQRGEPFFRRLTNGLRETLQRAGISYGLYLQSDLTVENFPTDARLYLFLTPYRLPVEQRDAIKEKLQNGGKTLAWLYAPGSCEERPSIGGILEDGTNGTVGMTLRPQEWNSEIGSRVLDPRHPLMDRLPGKELGTRERLNPSYYVADEGAKVLAEYVGSGLPSIAVKENPGWKSVFIGEPVLPLELLRGICRYAGVHLWTPQGDDVVAVGSGWVTIHAARDGQRTLRLPDALGLYDMTDSRLIADETREHRFFLKTGATRTFCVGSAERFQALDLPNYTMPGNGRARIVQNAGPAPRAVEPARAELVRAERPERTDSRPARESRPFNLPPPPPLPFTPSEEERRQAVETLRAIIAADPLEIEAVTLSAEVELASLDLTSPPIQPTSGGGPVPSLAELESEIAGNGRRRRRRGGRGRGRNRLPDGTEAPLDEETEMSEAPAGEVPSDVLLDDFAPITANIEPEIKPAEEKPETLIALPEPFRFHDESEPD